MERLVIVRAIAKQRKKVSEIERLNRRAAVPITAAGRADDAESKAAVAKPEH